MPVRTHFELLQRQFPLTAPFKHEGEQFSPIIHSKTSYIVRISLVSGKVHSKFFFHNVHGRNRDTLSIVLFHLLEILWLFVQTSRKMTLSRSRTDLSRKSLIIKIFKRKWTDVFENIYLLLVPFSLIYFCYQKYTKDLEPKSVCSKYK